MAYPRFLCGGTKLKLPAIKLICALIHAWEGSQVEILPETQVNEAKNVEEEAGLAVPTQRASSSHLPQVHGYQSSFSPRSIPTYRIHSE